jgi:glyoxylase I family protein
MALTVSHVGIACKDPAAIERFYTRHFGFQRSRVIPLGDEQIVFLKSGDFHLELFQAKGDAPVPPAGGAGPEFPGWRHLAVTVDSVEAKLAEMGSEARVTLGPLKFDDFIPGWATAWVSDPEGNIIEITHGYADEVTRPDPHGEQ